MDNDKVKFFKEDSPTHFKYVTKRELEKRRIKSYDYII